MTVGSAAFALALGGPRFTVTTHPGGAAAGAPFAQQPVVAVTDPAGNAIATGAGVVRYVRVTAALATSFVPAAVLSDAHGACPCAVRLRDGVAAFTSLALSHPGGGFVIEFTTEAVRFAAGPTRSAPFAVTGPAVYATVDGAPVFSKRNLWPCGGRPPLGHGPADGMLAGIGMTSNIPTCRF